MDYSHTYASFDWKGIRGWKKVKKLPFKGLSSGGINIAYKALESHRQVGSTDKLALR